MESVRWIKERRRRLRIVFYSSSSSKGIGQRLFICSPIFKNFFFLTFFCEKSDLIKPILGPSSQLFTSQNLTVSQWVNLVKCQNSNVQRLQRNMH